MIAARIEISSRSEQKIYGYDLLALPSAHFLQQTEQKDGGNWVNICYEKVVLSEYNSVSIINILKHLMLKLSMLKHLMLK